MNLITGRANDNNEFNNDDRGLVLNIAPPCLVYFPLCNGNYEYVQIPTSVESSLSCANYCIIK